MKKALSFFLLGLTWLISGCGPGQFLGPTLTPTPTLTKTPTPTSTATRTPLPTLTPSITMTPRPIKVAFDDICNYQGRTIITAGTIYTAITIFGGTIDGEYRQGLMFEKERFGFSYITLWIKANADPGPNEMAIAPDNWNRIDLEIHTYNNEIIWPRHLPEAEQPVGIQARVLPPFSGSKGCELILEELWKSPP